MVYVHVCICVRHRVIYCDGFLQWEDALIPMCERIHFKSQILHGIINFLHRCIYQVFSSLVIDQ